jgi:hypothetical protein
VVGGADKVHTVGRKLEDALVARTVHRTGLAPVGLPQRKWNKVHRRWLWSSLHGDFPLKDSKLREHLVSLGVATPMA